jgi:hypothetical protein
MDAEVRTHLPLYAKIVFWVLLVLSLAAFGASVVLSIVPLPADIMSVPLVRSLFVFVNNNLLACLISAGAVLLIAFAVRLFLSEEDIEE